MFSRWGCVCRGLGFEDGLFGLGRLRFLLLCVLVVFGIEPYDRRAGVEK
jgi:hypothetical protein